MIIATALLTCLGSAGLTADAAVDLLPSDSEAIICARAPGELREGSENVSLADQLPLLGLLSLPGATLPWKVSFNFVVEGSRNMRPPNGLGVMPFDGCAILGLSDEQLKKWRDKARAEAKQTLGIEKVTVYVLPSQREGDKWRFFIGFRDNVMFSATNEAYLREVLAPKQNNRAFAAFSREVKYVDLKSPFWAVRRFTDKTRRPLFGLNMGDDKIAGYGMSLSTDRTRFNVVSISDSPQGENRARAAWGGFAKQESVTSFLSVSKLDATATQITFDATLSDGGRATFMLLIALGHGVFV